MTGYKSYKYEINANSIYRMDFYLTLPSNTPNASVANHTNRFRISLPNTIELLGQWEVGLVEIMYPHSWPNLTGNEMPTIPKTMEEWNNHFSQDIADTCPNLIYFQYLPISTVWETAIVPPGNYQTPQELIKAIEKGLERQMDIIKEKKKLAFQFQKLESREKRSVDITKDSPYQIKKRAIEEAKLENNKQKKKIAKIKIFEQEKHARQELKIKQIENILLPQLLPEEENEINDLPGILEHLKINYDEVLKRVMIQTDSNVIGGVYFARQLQYMLGLDESHLMYDHQSLEHRIIQKYYVAKYPLDLKSGFYALFIYCDIVENQILGNIKAPLLRIVPTQGSFGDIINQTFHTPHYVPILKKQFNSIEICIKDDKNRLVPFDFGKCIIKLHLKKKRPIPL